MGTHVVTSRGQEAASGHAGAREHHPWPPAVWPAAVPALNAAPQGPPDRSLLALVVVAAARELAADPPPPLPCEGEACDRMTALLPKLRFKRRGYRIKCSCKDFEAGVCFAPGW